MKVAVTGGRGFLGWHFACRAFATRGLQSTRLGREESVDGMTLARHIAGHDVVVHLAAVNRAATDDEVLNGNLGAAQVLADAIAQNETPVRVVFANSTQSGNDTAYGRGKAGAADILREAAHRFGGNFSNVVLPNLFGEHGRPGYNSFVATFCRMVVDGEKPKIAGDRAMSLLHAQQAAEVLLTAAESNDSQELRPAGTERLISEVSQHLQALHRVYATGEVPALEDSFSVDLFNTYRSFLEPSHFPFATAAHPDARGQLVELARSHGGTSQSFVSTTEPGLTRGNHFHLSKFERFLVVEGEAEIALRRLFDGTVVRHRVNGQQPSFVDMPTMWTHSIRNVGEGRLVTAFWADQLLDPDAPDQFPLDVEGRESP